MEVNRSGNRDPYIKVIGTIQETEGKLTVWQGLTVDRMLLAKIEERLRVTSES